MLPVFSQHTAHFFFRSETFCLLLGSIRTITIQFIFYFCVYMLFFSVPFRATRVARTHKTHTQATAPLLFLVTISTEMVDTHTHISDDLSNLF